MATPKSLTAEDFNAEVLHSEIPVLVEFRTPG
jgi:hypothetical protein